MLEEGQSMSPNQQLIYLHRPNAFVPPSWHAILPDCYKIKKKKK